MKKTVNKMTKESSSNLPEKELQKYKRGDELQFGAKEVAVVEVIYEDHYHLKNKHKPFDSFIATGEEIEAQVKLYNAVMDIPMLAKTLIEDSKNKPDLLYRKDDTLDL